MSAYGSTVVKRSPADLLDTLKDLASADSTWLLVKETDLMGSE